jgi:hypothetical protein
VVALAECGTLALMGAELGSIAVGQPRHVHRPAGWSQRQAGLDRGGSGGSLRH